MTEADLLCFLCICALLSTFLFPRFLLVLLYFTFKELQDINLSNLSELFAIGFAKCSSERPKQMLALGLPSGEAKDLKADRPIGANVC